MQVNPKVARLASKIVLGVIGSAVIGYTIKAERMIEDRIEEHFAEKDDESENPSIPE